MKNYSHYPHLLYDQNIKNNVTCSTTNSYTLKLTHFCTNFFGVGIKFLNFFLIITMHSVWLFSYCCLLYCNCVEEIVSWVIKTGLADNKGGSNNNHFVCYCNHWHLSSLLYLIQANQAKIQLDKNVILWSKHYAIYYNQCIKKQETSYFYSKSTHNNNKRSTNWSAALEHVLGDKNTFFKITHIWLGLEQTTSFDRK